MEMEIEIVKGIIWMQEDKINCVCLGPKNKGGEL